MFNRPSARRKTKNAQITLNLVPILDAMVTLIGFLLYTMAFLQLVSIESPFPQASTADVQQKLKEKPLQLTVTMREKEIQIWSPFERIKTEVIPQQADGQPDLKKLHEKLIVVKQQFPKENKVVIVPYAQANYDLIISVMDSLRVLDKTDPAMFVKNDKTGVDEPVKALFPEVIFGNLLGDS